MYLHSVLSDSKIIKLLLFSHFIALAFHLKLFQSSRRCYWHSLKCSKLCGKDYYQKRVSFRYMMQELIFYNSRSFLKIYLKARHLVSVKNSRGLYIHFRTVLLILSRYCKTELCLYILKKRKSVITFWTYFRCHNKAAPKLNSSSSSFVILLWPCWRFSASRNWFLDVCSLSRQISSFQRQRMVSN